MMLKHFIHKSLSTNALKLYQFNSIRQFSQSQFINSRLVNQAELLARPDGKQMRKEPNRNEFKYSREIPDFELGPRRVTTQIEMTSEMSKLKHPLEYISDHMRKYENPYGQMNDNSLMLTNFPTGQAITQDYVHQIVLEANPKAEVKRIIIQEAMQGDKTSLTRAAFAIVEFELQSQSQTVNRGLRKKWIKDKLLKVRTMKDIKNETFNSRTLIVSNIKQQWSSSQLITAFSEFGAVTHLELPSLDAVVNAKLEEKGVLTDHYLRQSKKRKEQEYRYSQEVLKETLQQENQFEELLTKTIGEEKAQAMKKTNYTSFDMLDKERVSSFIRVMTHLQTEGITLKNSKTTLSSLLQEINTLDTSTSGLTQESLSKEVAKQLEANKDKLQSTLKYIVNNQESLDESQQSFIQQITNSKTADPVYKLQRMSMAELTQAYDFLLSILHQREITIKSRIQESVKFHQKEERVLFEKRDYTRETEQMPDVLRNILRYDFHAIDQFLDVDEQVEHIHNTENMKPEDKMYQYLTDTINLDVRKNFNLEQIDQATTTEYDAYREHEFEDDDNRTEIRSKGQPYAPFTEEMQDIIDNEVYRAEEAYETPFDQLYHKERKLVQDIVRTEQAIKKMQDELPDPAEFMKFDPNMLEDDEKYGNLFSNLEPQYLKDKREKERVLARKNHVSIYDESEDIRHSYKEQAAQTVEDYIVSGQIKRSEYEIAKHMHIQNRMINLGYAMVTFSHADEARQALLITNGEFILDNRFVDVMLKDKLDHSEMDRAYFMRKMMNESKIVEHRTELREAQQNLRDFERNIEQEIPTLQKLKDFKSIAQEMIEDRKGKTRRHGSQRRDKREIDEMYEKLREYQAQNPLMDLSSLFENYEADRARLQMHKRALQSYKKFEFLKGGVKQAVEKKTKQSEIYEPFNYPGLKDTVTKVFVDGFETRIADAGDNSSFSSTRQRRGRRFDKYTEQEFLESYLGKDYARRPSMDNDPYNETFGYQQSLREMFSDENEFMQFPELQEEKDRLNKFMGQFKIDGKPIDPQLANFLKTVDTVKFMQQFNEPEVRHPTDPNRTFNRDIQNKWKELQMKAQKKGKNDMNGHVFSSFLRELQDEYSTNPLFNDEDGSVTHQIIEDHAQNFEEKIIKEEKALEKMTEEYSEVNIKKMVNASLMKELAKYDTDGTLADFLKDPESMLGGKSRELEYVSEEEEGFEKESMFEPESNGQADGKSKEQAPKKPAAQKSFKKAKKYNQTESVQKPLVKEMIEISSGTPDFGSKLKQRQSNENLYNIQHLAKINQLDTTQPNVHEYQLLAENITKFRHEQFNKIKSLQDALPMSDRVPHYMGQDGIPLPYSQHELETMHDNEIINVLNLQDTQIVPNCTVADIFKTFKKHAFVGESLDRKEGEMFKYQQTEMDEYDLATHEFRNENGDRSLGEYLDNQKDGQDDIYESYIKHDNKIEQIKTTERKQIRHSEEQDRLLKEADQNLLKKPTFEEFFNKQAQGKDMFDNYSGVDNEERDEQEEIHRIQEEQENDNLYRRELLARLFGGKLTARQYSVLLNMTNLNDVDEALKKANEYKNKVSAKDEIRNSEEILESQRRKMVLQGNWKEHESHQKIQQALDDLYNMYPTEQSMKVALREDKKRLTGLFEVGMGTQMQEREYYFDEGLGETLNEHVKDLKKQLKQSEITTRRDGDGLPIVKIYFKPTFKYDIDKIMGTDPEEIMRIEKETTEAILKEHGASTDPAKILNLVNGIISDEFLVDNHKKELLEKLHEERFYGKYKNDLPGYIAEYSSIRKMMNTSSEPAMIDGLATANPFTVKGRSAYENMAFAQLQKDQRQLDYEIHYQLKMKINEKVLKEKREMKDFVKPARSENLLYRQQMETIDDVVDMIERDNEWLLNAGDSDQLNKPDDGFNQAEYRRVRKEIKMQKETKEKMISQGFPEFKPYTRI